MADESDPGTTALAEEDRLLKDHSARFFAREFPPTRVKDAVTSGWYHSREFWTALGAEGYLAVSLPEALGGAGCGPSSVAVLAEEAGRACAPGPFVAHFAACGLLAHTALDSLEGRAGHSRRDGLLRDLGAGTALAVIAAGGTMRARPDGSGYLVSGVVPKLADAGAADYLLVAPRTPGGTDLLGLVDAGGPGIEIVPMPTMDHMHPAFRVVCTDLRLSPEQVLAVGPPAAHALFRGASLALLAATASMIGTMDWVLSATIRHLDGVREMGRQPAAFSDVLPRCRELFDRIGACRDALHGAAEGGQGEPIDAAGLARARDLTTAACAELRELLLQRQEGMGLTFEADLHLFRSIPPYYESIA